MADKNTLPDLGRMEGQEGFMRTSMSTHCPRRTYSIRWRKDESVGRSEQHHSPRNKDQHAQANDAEVCAENINADERGSHEIVTVVDLSLGLEDITLYPKVNSSELTDHPARQPVNLLNQKYMGHGQDIEDIGCWQIDQKDVTPLERFKKKGKLSVTDLAGQLWCEKQLEFTLITGRKRVTKAMQLGVERHLLLEFHDHEVVEVEVDTREDDLGLRLLNTITLLGQLCETGRAREIWVFGILDGVLVRGIVDEMEIRTRPDGVRRVVISDTKTRSEEREPSNAQQQTSALQLQLYQWIVNELCSEEVDMDYLFQIFKCDPNVSFKVECLNDFQNLRSLAYTFQQEFSRLPPLEDYVEIVYECDSKEFGRKQIPYSETSTLYTVHELLDWWRGIRTKAQHVTLSERWKCRWCDFIGDCNTTPLTSEEVQSVLHLRHERESKQQLTNQKTYLNCSMRTNAGLKGVEDPEKKENGSGEASWRQEPISLVDVDSRNVVSKAVSQEQARKSRSAQYGMKVSRGDENKKQEQFTIDDTSYLLRHESPTQTDGLADGMIPTFMGWSDVAQGDEPTHLFQSSPTVAPSYPTCSHTTVATNNSNKSKPCPPDVAPNVTATEIILSLDDLQQLEQMKSLPESTENLQESNIFHENNSGASKLEMNGSNQNNRVQATDIQVVSVVPKGINLQYDSSTNKRSVKAVTNNLKRKSSGRHAMDLRSWLRTTTEDSSNHFSTPVDRSSEVDSVTVLKSSEATIAERQIRTPDTSSFIHPTSNKRLRTW